MRIQTTEAVRRFNAQLELADLATWNLCDCMDVEQLPHYLNQSGFAELAECLIAAGKAIGYFGAPGVRPTAAPVCETKGEYKMSEECPEPAWLNSRSHLERQHWKIQAHDQLVTDCKNLMEECRYLRNQLRAFANQVQAAGLIVPPNVRQCIS